MLCIAVNEAGEYLTPRRNTGIQYESRAGWSPNFCDAKVFQNKAAAKNSAKQAGCENAKVFALDVAVGEEL